LSNQRWTLKIGAGSDLPAGRVRQKDGGLTLGPSSQLLGLAGGGVCPANVVTDAAVRSYRTISPLPVFRQAEIIGCVFSVALSRGSPRVAVSHHRALSCSDFPPAFIKSQQSPDPLFSIDYLLFTIDYSGTNYELL